MKESNVNRICIVASTLAVAAVCTAGSALARDQLQIAGSSTVLPYAQIVAEDFGKTYSKFKTPVVESGGSSAGLKQFCQGRGEATIDIANSSRPIKEAEVKECTDKGVKNIRKVPIGYDGIMLTSSEKALDMVIDR